MLDFTNTKSARERVEAARAALKDAVNNDEFALVNRLNIDLHFAQGGHEVVYTYERSRARLEEKLAEGAFTPIQMMFMLQAKLTRMIMNGPDDQWSGSGNEVNRAHFRGRCEAVTQLNYVLQTEAEKLFLAEKVENAR